MDRSYLRSQMSPDESVIWEGRPKKSAFILKSFFNFLLPISIVWVAVDSVGIFSIFSEDAGMERFFLIPFFALHLLPVWLYLGNIIFSFLRYRNTQYLLTDRNLYLSGGIFAKEVRIKPLSRLSNIQSRVGLFDKLCHVGSIVLDEQTDSVDSTGRTKATEIQSIPDFDDLLKRIRSLQYEAASDLSFPNKFR